MEALPLVSSTVRAGSDAALSLLHHTPSSMATTTETTRVQRRGSWDGVGWTAAAVAEK